jgi:hypothetical protein
LITSLILFAAIARFMASNICVEPTEMPWMLARRAMISHGRQRRPSDVAVHLPRSHAFLRTDMPLVAERPKGLEILMLPSPRVSSNILICPDRGARRFNCQL